jgi:hypothetical protein
MVGVQKKCERVTERCDVGSRPPIIPHCEDTQHVNVTCSHVSACNVGACKLSVRKKWTFRLRFNRQLCLCEWVPHPQAGGQQG